jgi:hypothetical protein
MIKLGAIGINEGLTANNVRMNSYGFLLFASNEFEKQSLKKNLPSGLDDDGYSLVCITVLSTYFPLFLYWHTGKILLVQKPTIVFTGNVQAGTKETHLKARMRGGQ